jgi:hypothetical protein
MGEDHHIVTHIIETKYDDNEAFKNKFNRDQNKQNANKKESVELWGYSSH